VINYLRSVNEYIANTNDIYRGILPHDLYTHPIPFFGDVLSAEIITMGVNPAASQFHHRHGWPREFAAEYFDQRLRDYFTSGDHTSHPWFDKWEEAIHVLGYSYEGGAAHVDLSARVTINMGDIREEDTGLFLDMIKEDAQFLFRLLPLCRKAKLVLAAGSVTKKKYINEILHEVSAKYGFNLSHRFRRHEVPGRGKVFCHRLEGQGMDLPLFFCGVSPSARNASLLVQRIRENRECLLRHLPENRVRR
jgi:hypothetical protein